MLAFLWVSPSGEAYMHWNGKAKIQERGLWEIPEEEHRLALHPYHIPLNMSRSSISLGHNIQSGCPSLPPLLTPRSLTSTTLLRAASECPPCQLPPQDLTSLLCVFNQSYFQWAHVHILQTKRVVKEMWAQGTSCSVPACSRPSPPSLWGLVDNLPWYWSN